MIMALGKQELENVRVLINQKIDCEKISNLASIVAIIFLFLTATVVLGEWDTTSFFLYLTFLFASSHIAYKFDGKAEDIKSQLVKKLLDESEAQENERS
jgi:hypothetical protein